MQANNIIMFKSYTILSHKTWCRGHTSNLRIVSRNMACGQTYSGSVFMQEALPLLLGTGWFQERFESVSLS